MKLSRLFILVSFILFSITVSAQNTFYSEIDAKWKFKPVPENGLSYSFGSLYRSKFHDSEKLNYNTDFLQLNVAQSYAINSNQSVSLEFRYRFKNLFDSRRTDEKRLIQQYNHNHKYRNLSFKGRLRVEQRFRENFNLRNRYRLGVTLDINNNPNTLKNWQLTTDAEVFWSVSHTKRPVIDRRFSLILEKPITNTLTFKLKAQSLEYKSQQHYSDYTRYYTQNVWRVFATLSISL